MSLPRRGGRPALWRPLKIAAGLSNTSNRSRSDSVTGATQAILAALYYRQSGPGRNGGGETCLWSSILFAHADAGELLPATSIIQP